MLHVCYWICLKCFLKVPPSQESHGSIHPVALPGNPCARRGRQADRHTHTSATQSPYLPSFYFYLYQARPRSEEQSPRRTLAGREGQLVRETERESRVTFAEKKQQQHKTGSHTKHVEFSWSACVKGPSEAQRSLQPGGHSQGSTTVPQRSRAPSPAQAETQTRREPPPMTGLYGWPPPGRAAASPSGYVAWHVAPCASPCLAPALCRTRLWVSRAHQPVSSPPAATGRCCSCGSGGAW